MNRYNNDDFEQLSPNGYSEYPQTDSNVEYNNSQYVNPDYAEPDYTTADYGTQSYENPNSDYAGQSYSNAYPEGQVYPNADYSNTYPEGQVYPNADYSNTYPEGQVYPNTGYSNTYPEGQVYPNTGYSNSYPEEQVYTNTDYSNSYPEEQVYPNTDYSNAYPEEQVYTNTDYSNSYPEETVSSNEPTSFANHVVQFEESEENLTPAELEDLKRQKEAARRRKMAAREARLRERRKQAIIRCSILLLIVILIIFGIVKLISGIAGLVEKNKKAAKQTEQVTEEPITTEEPVAKIDESILAKPLPADRETALQMLKEQSETNPELKSLYDSAAVYSDTLLRYLACNNEMKDFVLAYPAKVNTVYDGEFSVDVSPTEVPLFLVYDERWGYADYGNNLLAINGVAPTCLSMACVYLNQDGSQNPIKVGDFSMANNYIDENSVTKEALMTDGAQALGLTSSELEVSKDEITTALAEMKVLICAVDSGDFTKETSYIVIHDYKYGFFYINDPTSKARSEVGWDYKRLSSQITKIWALGAGTGTNNSPSGDSDNTDGTQTDNNDANGNNTDNNTTGNNDNNTITNGDNSTAGDNNNNVTGNSDNSNSNNDSNN